MVMDYLVTEGHKEAAKELEKAPYDYILNRNVSILNHAIFRRQRRSLVLTWMPSERGAYPWRWCTGERTLG